MSDERRDDRAHGPNREVRGAAADGARAVVGIVMGVAGVGKTTVGRRVAELLGWDFVDGDAYHPASNVEKMSRGIALKDEDRREWLETLRAIIDARVRENRPTILTCSALKAAYRGVLVREDGRTLFVYLKAPRDIVRERIRRRTGHFFDGDLLESQYEALEEPTIGITIDATQPLDTVVEDIVRALRA